jgi:hypothetical protein
MTTWDDVERFRAGLEASGWFVRLPAETARAVRRGLDHVVPTSQTLTAGLVLVAADSEYLLDDRPYLALLRQFEAASAGRLALEEARQIDYTGKVRLEFAVSGHRYELDLPVDADDVPPSFLAAVNDAMARSGTPLRFVELSGLGWGPVPGFTLADPEAHDRAARAGLFPVPAPGDEVNLDAAHATLTRVFLGRRVYYWVLDGQTVAEVTLVGHWDQETTVDRRAEGGGVETTFAYPGLAAVTFLCAPPADRPTDLGPEFRIDETQSSSDRVTRRGHIFVEGTEMEWRQDKLSGVPVHLLAVASPEIAGAFGSALDSFRLLERSAALQALFATCGSEKAGKPAAPTRRPRKPGRA